MPTCRVLLYCSVFALSVLLLLLRAAQRAEPRQVQQLHGVAHAAVPASFVWFVTTRTTSPGSALPAQPRHTQQRGGRT